MGGRRIMGEEICIPHTYLGSSATLGYQSVGYVEASTQSHKVKVSCQIHNTTYWSILIRVVPHDMEIDEGLS